VIKKIGIVLFIIIVLVIVYFTAVPSRIDPAAYRPPAGPGLTGVLAPNELLKNAALLGGQRLEGPEDVAFDAKGRLYTGTGNGEIVRVSGNGAAEVFAETKGRPLGLHFDALGRLVVCDAYRGLLSIDGEGRVSTLAVSAEGVPFKFANGIDISGAGTIYFSDSSDTFYQKDYLCELLEAKPHGRLMSYMPKTGKTSVLLDDLYFPNGVALSEKEDFVVVCETFRYRLTRFWLRGPKRGTSEVFIDNLPGFPDGVSSDGSGTFWIALFALRNDLMDTIHRYPLIKKLISKLPRFFRPEPASYGLVLAVNEKGEIIRSLHEPSGTHMGGITSARTHGGRLYLGGMCREGVGVYELENMQ